MEATVFLLAGGKSTRMGMNKALLEVDGKTMLERLKDEFQPLTPKIVLLTGSHSYPIDLPQLPDDAPFQGCGPLAGIYTGLLHTDTEINLFVACDMPFVSRRIGKWMMEELAKTNQDAIIPMTDGILHPLFAVYKTSAKEAAKIQLQRKQYRLKEFLGLLDKKIVAEHDVPDALKAEYANAFWNMNDPASFKVVKTKIKGMKRNDV
ncbi:MAG: molybdenum cofactor guanylyltransferase [Bacillales bacterium]|nr:molybdenum cofactor guanylyltransferase [Bacillales bacterium]